MKVLKGIISLSIVTSIIFLMIPFNIHAENVAGSSPIIGVNITVTDYEYSKIPIQATVNFTTDQTRWACYASNSNGCIAWQSVGTDSVVDDKITGNISYTTSGNVTGYLYEYDFVFDNEYVGYIDFSSNTIGATTASRYFVNGSHLLLTSTQLISSFTISSYQLIENTIKSASWNFPMESYLPIAFSATRFQLTDFYDIGNYKYPLFVSNTDQYVYRLRQSEPIRIIIWSTASIYNIATFNNYFSYIGTASNFVSLNAVQGQYLFSIDISGEYANFLDLKWKVANINFIPIFINYASYEMVSTDFALMYGLNNRLLNDIDLIAQGTNQSNTAASDLESSNSQMAQDMNDLATIESGYNQQFNNSLQTIDFSNPVQSNQGMLPAANFVITIFNGLITNNPFSVLIIIVCILLIGKKVIGK